MKILHVFDVLSPHTNGTSHFLYQLAKAQAARGHEVTIYTTDYKSEKAYLDTLAPVKVYPFHYWSRIGGFYYTPGLDSVAKKDISRYDVIHIHCFRSYQNTIVHHYARKYGVPYVLEHHGSLPRDPAGEKGLKVLLKWLYDLFWGYRILRDAARLITQNQLGVREYAAFGVGKEKVTIFPHLYPVEDFANLPPRGEFRDKYVLRDRRIVIFLGRLNIIKGLDFLVESFGELARRRQDITLVMVGPDEGCQPVLEKQIARLGIGDLVLFTGFLDGREKLAALVDADVMVQPSRYEYAGLAAVEAVLCGTPVIASEGTGCGEDMSGMGMDYLVPFGDRAKLMQMIDAILDNPPGAKAKVRKAQDYIKANLSFSSKVKDYESLYQQFRSVDARPETAN